MKTYQWRVVTTDAKDGYFKAQFRVLRNFPWFWTTLGCSFTGDDYRHFIYETVPEAELDVQKHTKSLKTKENKFKTRTVTCGCITF